MMVIETVCRCSGCGMLHSELAMLRASRRNLTRWIGIAKSEYYPLHAKVSQTAIEGLQSMLSDHADEMRKRARR